MEDTDRSAVFIISPRNFFCVLVSNLPILTARESSQSQSLFIRFLGNYLKNLSRLSKSLFFGFLDFHPSSKFQKKSLIHILCERTKSLEKLLEKYQIT